MASSFACAVLGLSLSTPASADGRETVPLDSSWRFHLGDAPDAFRPDLDDSFWRAVELPHDWSIEGQTGPSEPSAGGGGFFPTGVGWYRRAFHASSSWGDRRVGVEFEGVYRNAEVWINGHRLGLHPYGYTPFRHDLTPHLRLGAENVLAVRADNSSQPNSRWYTGSGIYRHVRLVVADPVHLEPGAVFVATTDATAESATVQVELAVRNERPTLQAVAGPAAIAGIGSGDLTARESYRTNPRRVFRGRAVVILRATREPGVIRLSAAAAGMEDASVRLESGR